MSNVIVVGRVGSQLANMLSDNGSNVCVIDRSADAFANLGRNFNGSTLQGVGFDEDTLVKAGVDDCDVVAAVTQLDNTNLMVAEGASRLFGVPTTSEPTCSSASTTCAAHRSSPRMCSRR